MGCLLLSIYMSLLLADCLLELPGTLLREAQQGSQVEGDGGAVVRGLKMCRCLKALNSATWPFYTYIVFVYMIAVGSRSPGKKPYEKNSNIACNAPQPQPPSSCA